ncbi:hypothetical protein GF325_16410 [Candidatus Bathyarchaeota archaeon]|nr:hypothetical protein [Candidatus Bathyarchaeota archaeon]
MKDTRLYPAFPDPRVNWSPFHAVTSRSFPWRSIRRAIDSPARELHGSWIDGSWRVYHHAGSITRD